MTCIDNFLTLLSTRSSVRKFAVQNVKKEKIELLLESARLAPSAVNFQPWHFIVVTGVKHKKMLCQSYQREWFAEAPVYIIACGDHQISWKRKFDGKDHCDIDIAIAVEHICLCATAQGLGSCWVCNFDADKVKKDFLLAPNIEPIAIIPIGYPIDKAITAPKNRKTITDIAEWVED